MRKTIQGLKAFLNAGGTLGSNAFDLTVVKVSGGDGYKFKANIATSGGIITLAAANGKIKLFSNMDDLMKQMAAYQLTSMGVALMNITNPEVLDAKPFTGDPVAKAVATRASYITKRATEQANADAITTAIALMPVVTLAEQALVAERTEQRDAVLGTVSYYDAEIARITSVLGS